MDSAPIALGDDQKIPLGLDFGLYEHLTRQAKLRAKHDDFRVLARRDDERIRLLSRRGLDLGRSLPAIVARLTRLRASCHARAGSTFSPLAVLPVRVPRRPERRLAIMSWPLRLSLSNTPSSQTAVTGKLA